jgi:anti-sigma B factor antagonist
MLVVPPLDTPRRADLGLLSTVCLTSDRGEPVKPYTISIAQDPSRVVIGGEVDLACAEPFEAELRSTLRTEGIDLLDLGPLTFIDSSGLHALVECASSRNGSPPLRIMRASDHVRRIMEIAGIGQVGGIELAVAESV